MLDFYEDVQRLLTIAFPGESSPEVDQIGLDIFLDGITNIKFVDEAKKHRPKNCAEAYRWASEAEGNSILSGVRPAKDPAEEDRQRALKTFRKVDRRRLVSEGESDRTQRFADTQRASPSKGTELTDVTDIFQDSDEDKDWWETDTPEIETGLRDLSVQGVAPDQPPAYEAVRGVPASDQDQESGERNRGPRPPPRP